jgi:ribosomal protein S18 acetylase RimI-like enzyme
MIQFQTATLSQAQELAHLVNSAYRGEYAEQGWTSEANILGGQRTDAESLSAIIQTPRHQIEMAFDRKTQKLIGCVHLIQELPDTLYFGMLTVEPKLQGNGLGKILLNHVESVAKTYGLSRIRFTVIPNRTELVAFYERRGYSPTGRTEAFPENDPKFGLPKVEGLALKEFAKSV